MVLRQPRGERAGGDRARRGTAPIRKERAVDRGSFPGRRAIEAAGDLSSCQDAGEVREKLRHAAQRGRAGLGRRTSLRAGANFVVVVPELSAGGCLFGDRGEAL